MKRKLKNEAFAVQRKILNENKRKKDDFVQIKYGKAVAERKGASAVFVKLAYALPVAILAIVAVTVAVLGTAPLHLGKSEPIANRTLAASEETFFCIDMTEEELKEEFADVIGFDFQTATSVKIQKVLANGSEKETFYNVRFVNETDFIIAEIVLVKNDSEYEFDITIEPNKRIRRTHNGTLVLYQRTKKKNGMGYVTSEQAKFSLEQAQVFVFYGNYGEKSTDVYDWMINVLTF